MRGNCDVEPIVRVRKGNANSTIYSRTRSCHEQVSKRKGIIGEDVRMRAPFQWVCVLEGSPTPRGIATPNGELGENVHVAVR